MLLVHGTEDPTVDLVQSTAMRDALAGAGVPVVYAELEGAGHGFGLLSTEPVNRAGICTTVEFLRRTLSVEERTEEVAENE
jgi:acetyl esterase/lipase